MYTIGEFAAFGRVSVRMLRHYDEIGLLAPAHVDPSTGYRFYEPAQLAPLMRIVELRALGCSLDDAADVLGALDHVTAMRTVLERRGRALSATIAAEQAQLADIESRLRHIEGGTMSTTEISYRSIAPLTVYAASGTAAGMGPEFVSPVVDSLLGPLEAALTAAGTAFDEPGVFWYEPDAATDGQVVWVSWVAAGTPRTGPGYEIVELPAIERAATALYRGAMPGIGEAWRAFMEAVSAAGEEPSGACREVYLEAEGPQETWLTELVIPLAAR